MGLFVQYSLEVYYLWGHSGVFAVSTRQLIKFKRDGDIMEKESRSVTPEFIRHVSMGKGFQNVSRIGMWRF